jgi:hypothetical protein
MTYLGRDGPIFAGLAAWGVRASRSTACPAGTKRGAGRGGFIDSLLDAVDTFYEQVIQNLEPWLCRPAGRC